MEIDPSRTEQRILCAACGTAIAPNPANMCISCIRNEVDITEGIPKQANLHYCRGCNRYLQPPNSWATAELESQQLLTICLKRLRGLNKVRLVDAGFIWTEPNSRRVKVKLTIQKEVFASTILQQVFVVEYYVAYQQCNECARVEAQLTWKASVQVRQKVAHKRTFLWLEQLILKHNAHKDTSNIKEAKDGIDFYYGNRSHAIKMMDFLQSVVPVRTKVSEQLISTDIHTSTSNYKYSYSVEILPLCKDDLVVLTPKMARSLSNINPLCVCYKISNAVYLIDPNTLKVAELRPQLFWENPFPPLCEARDLIEFYIIDIQQEGAHHGKFGLATVEVARANDLSKTFIVRTHLGHILRAGDHAMGYQLNNANFNNTNWDTLTSTNNHNNVIPDVVLIKKSYPQRRSKTRQRNWKLKSIAKETDEENGGKRAIDQAKAELDYELFMRDLEEDAELRGMVNLYKAPKRGGEPEQEDEEDMEDEDDEEFPEISVNELLDDLEGMTLEDGEGDVDMA
ncbi:hypothetical protein HK098_008050 [Nowakowskiella sp. JEL0407]|nr:hypothetical protein HK098_008050 [Nowakowskiella sp. JEL0407]